MSTLIFLGALGVLAVGVILYLWLSTGPEDDYDWED